jgi:excisionase family DNA binding protein
MKPAPASPRLTPLERLLMAQEAAEILNVERRTLMEWARRKQIPCIVLSWRRDGRAGAVRFEESVLREWIAARRQGATR